MSETVTDYLLAAGLSEGKLDALHEILTRTPAEGPAPEPDPEPAPQPEPLPEPTPRPHVYPYDPWQVVPQPWPFPRPAYKPQPRPYVLSCDRGYDLSRCEPYALPYDRMYDLSQHEAYALPYDSDVRGVTAAGSDESTFRYRVAVAHHVALDARVFRLVPQRVTLSTLYVAVRISL